MYAVGLFPSGGLRRGWTYPAQASWENNFSLFSLFWMPRYSRGCLLAADGANLPAFTIRSRVAGEISLCSYNLIVRLDEIAEYVSIIFTPYQFD